MRLPRFSIAGLLAFVLVCGLGLAALKAASGMWASVTVTVAAVALLTSIVGAAKGRNRAGWFGFAVFGWGYLVLNFMPGFKDVVQPHLLTTRFIVESFRYMHPKPKPMSLAALLAPGQPPKITPFHHGEEKVQAADPQFVVVAEIGPARIIDPSARDLLVVFGQDDFFWHRIIGHSLTSILAGVLGWIIAVIVADRRPEGGR
jgi:hypothetical protein